MRRQYTELLAPKGRLQLHHVGKILGACETRGQVEARIDVTPREIDDLAVEGGGTLAGCVEGPLECRQGCIESFPGSVISLAALRHGLLGKGAHSVWNGGVETEETELDRRVAVFAAGLIGCDVFIISTSQPLAGGAEVGG